VATLEWPPAADDLNAIVCVDLRATSGVVREPRDVLYRRPAARRPSPPASRVGDGHGLRWPPADSDLDGITAWSVLDGAPRPAIPQRRRAMGWSRMVVTGVVAMAALVAVAQLPEPPALVAPSVERIATRQSTIADRTVVSTTRDASATPVAALPVSAEGGRSEPALPRTPAAGQAVPSRPDAARAETVSAHAASPLAKAVLTPPPAPVVTPPTPPREAGDIAERVPNGRRTSEPPPEPRVPALAASTELAGRVPEVLPAPFAAATLPAALVTPPVTTAVARPESAPVRDLDEPRIKAVLSRYGAAYSRLDAGAAREVWPTVDARALSRAFESLRSQEVVLGACEIAIDGDRAQAACRGTSTYVPRVGDPTPRRESRQWRFQLARTDETAWHIKSAESR
jgi:hypothetical protein